MGNNVKIDLSWEIMLILNKHQAYWFTAEALSWDLGVSEKLIIENLEQLTEWGLLEHLPLTLEWWRITAHGVTKVAEYRLARRRA